MQVDRYRIHDIEVVIDRLMVEPSFKVRISQSVQQALKMGKDLMFLLVNDQDKIVQYSKQLMCEDTGLSYEEPSPNAFSFNSPYGACPTCKGLGNVHDRDEHGVTRQNKKRKRGRYRATWRRAQCQCISAGNSIRKNTRSAWISRCRTFRRHNSTCCCMAIRASMPTWALIWPMIRFRMFIPVVTKASYLC